MTHTEIAKTSQINIQVGMNAEAMPVRIDWSASDSNTEPGDAKAMLLSLFDRETKDTLKIDLWTKDMQVIEMDRFFYQTLRALSDTYVRATGNNKLGSQMAQFVQFFGEETEVLPKT